VAAAAAAAAIAASSQYLSAFVARYQREYGFTLDRPLVIDDIRVRGVGHTDGVQRVPIQTHADPSASRRPQADKVARVFFDADGQRGHFLDTAVHVLSSLHADDEIRGPALVIDQTSSTLIEPGCEAKVTLYGDLEIFVGVPDDQADADADAVVQSQPKIGLEPLADPSRPGPMARAVTARRARLPDRVMPPLCH